jgi:hypothetical protein
MPGVIHRFTNLHAFNEEISEARIVAGFHWRFSTVVGKDMGWKIGVYTVKCACERDRTRLRRLDNSRTLPLACAPPRPARHLETAQ